MNQEKNYINKRIMKMSNKVKDIDMKNITYSFFNDIINIENLYLNNVKIYRTSYKKILIYYIGHVTIKGSKCVKIHIVNPSYVLFGNVNGYFEEINKSKYLTLVPTNERLK